MVSHTSGPMSLRTCPAEDDLVGEPATTLPTVGTTFVGTAGVGRSDLPDLPAAEVGLKPVAVEQWLDFIFVNFDTSARKHSAVNRLGWITCSHGRVASRGFRGWRCGVRS